MKNTNTPYLVFVVEIALSVVHSMQYKRRGSGTEGPVKHIRTVHGEMARGWGSAEHIAPGIRRGWCPREWGEGGLQGDWNKTHQPRECGERRNRRGTARCTEKKYVGTTCGSKAPCRLSSTTHTCLSCLCRQLAQLLIVRK